MKKLYTTCILFLLINSFSFAQSWKQTGPVNFPVNVSGQINGIGRVTQLKFHPTLANKMYVTSASGGLYGSSDNGNTWTMMGTDRLPAAACASVCIDYTDDNILYLSTGDPNYYGTDYGIYKTVNAGTTWTLANNNIGNRMAVEMLMDPADHNTIIAATNDGIWSTTNGGTSWTNVKSGGAFRDMKRRPATNTLYAVTESECWISNNYGVSWTQVTNGVNIPSGTDGLRLGVSAADNNVVYIVANGNNGVLFKSVNAGISFTQVYSSSTQCIVCYDEDPGSGTQGNYNLGMCADPFDASHVYVVGHCLWESNDGGNTFQQKTEWYDELHTDHHQVEVDPYDANQLWNINDGGVWRRQGTNDSLWDPKSDGVGATEIYHAGQATRNKKLLSIGTQDNGELFYDGTWKTNRGGDWGSRVYFDYSAGNTIYYLSEGERRTFTPYGGSSNYNSPFTPTNDSRIAFHQNLPDIALLSENAVWMTRNLTDGTPSWTNIFSTTNDTRDLCISTADSTIAFVISDNNRFTRIQNLLTTPVITNLNTPASTSIRGSVAAVKGNVNVVYISCNNRVYRSADQGNTWTNITYNLPATNILKIYHDDFSNDETVYVCTGNKVYSKNNAATTWTDISYNLPSIANVTDFMMYNKGDITSKLLVSYYGRGVWELALHPNYPPVADFTNDKTYVCPGQSVQFTDLSEGDNLIYNWNFQGGTPATSAAQNPSVTYNTAGIYSVSLTVSNSNGNNIKTINAYILVGTGSPEIVAEGFQYASYPPANWRLMDGGNDGVNWFKNNAAGGFGNSSTSSSFDNYNNDTQGNKDRLLLPVMDLTSFSSATLTFDVAYAPYSTTDYLDSLLVAVSTDCGSTYTYLYTKYGSTLATAPANTGGTFVPTATQWRTETINLNNFISSSNLLIAFENRGHYGQQVFIDNVNLRLNPFTAFTANNTTICAGSSVNFTDQSSGLVNSWNWTFAGGTPATSTEQNPIVTFGSAGVYNVTLSTGNATGGSQQLIKSGYITVTANPVPLITATDRILTCNLAATAYQWYLNGNIISGATQQTYNAADDGNYTVMVTDANGCTGVSAAIAIPVVVPANGVPGIQVYPVPSSGMVYISSGDITGAAKMRLYNAAGQLVMEKTFSDMTTRNEINIAGLAAGVYELKLITEKGTYVKKIQRNQN
ncbi:MAG: PKD domain-containing protein [Bacteroidetes bacterium]|nr:PKD domain-containing protein [Bacteroidota bacterium]